MHSVTLRLDQPLYMGKLILVFKQWRDFFLPIWDNLSQVLFLTWEFGGIVDKMKNPINLPRVFDI